MRSCVSLFSAVCGQPVDVMERWLDLYYQVRHAQEKADAAARAAERLKEAEPFLIPGTLEAVDTRATARVAPTGKDEAADAGRPLSVTAASGGDCKLGMSHAARASECSPQGASQENAEKAAKSLPKEAPSQSAAPTALPGGASQGPVKRPGGKGTPRPSQIGNTRGLDAAVFKRQVRDRLVAVREKGVSAPEIVRAAPAGSVTESDIYMILQGHVIRIDIYRALDEALRHFES